MWPFSLAPDMLNKHLKVESDQLFPFILLLYQHIQAILTYCPD